MVNRLFDHALRLEPFTGTRVQSDDLLRRRATFELFTEQVTEHLLIAEPSVLCVERSDEEVSLLQRIDELLACAAGSLEPFGSELVSASGFEPQSPSASQAAPDAPEARAALELQHVGVVAGVLLLATAFVLRKRSPGTC